jgi:hypothetical protein
MPTPASLRQAFDAAGRPKAHGAFDRICDDILGNMPLEDARRKRFNDYYTNCVRNVDRSIEAVLAELEALGLSQNTIVVFTADHGARWRARMAFAPKARSPITRRIICRSTSSIQTPKAAGSAAPLAARPAGSFRGVTISEGPPHIAEVLYDVLSAWCTSSRPVVTVAISEAGALGVGGEGPDRAFGLREAERRHAAVDM